MSRPKDPLKMSKDCVSLLEAQNNMVTAAKAFHTELKKLIAYLEPRNRSFPAGNLSILSRKGHPSYYHVLNRSPKKATYLSFTSQQSLIQALAQKSYEKTILSLAKKSLLSFEKRDIDQSLIDIIKVYSALSPQRKQLVNPLFLPDEEYIEQWKEKHAAKSFFEQDAIYITDNDERVRSKSELYIANQLLSFGVPYCYEPVLKLDNVTFRPDFLVLNIRTRKEYYWEHMGMMDKPSYTEGACQKLNIYEKKGFFPGEKVIISFESASSPLDTEAIKQLIRHYCL